MVLFHDGRRQHLRPKPRGKRSVSLAPALTEEDIIVKAIVVTDQNAGTAGMKLAQRPEPQAAI
ncbi:MAG TPA: hypothetical protein VJT13_04120, partial [Xanthobacteraceae bacterium]|nr:hypothetical protein [Xanthobacteraceae bacterium]